jgi:hypothetical protein
MALIAIVDGVKLYMYGNDHPPPHFHVLFAEYRAVIALQTLKLSRGELPKAKLKAILKWARPRRDKLLAAWNMTQALLDPGSIQ